MKKEAQIHSVRNLKKEDNLTRPTSNNNIGQKPTSNLNLTVYTLLKQGIRPSKICNILNKKPNALQYYLTTLKKAGFVKNIGKGVWEILKEYDENLLQITTKVAQDNIGQLQISKQDSIRGHAFQFTLRIPKLLNWEKREEVFKKKGISYDPLNILGGGQKILFRGRKVWITNNSIVVYEKSSYMAETPRGAKDHAIYDFLNLVNGIENLLGANFKIRKRYMFKVTRQHFALVKNALAQQYDKEGKKLYVYNKEGTLWFLIDNSYHLHEAEGVHPKTAEDDTTKVQTFFNEVKELDGFTPNFIMEALGKLIKHDEQNIASMAEYNENIKLHVQVQREQLATQKEMQKALKELRESLKK